MYEGILLDNTYEDLEPFIGESTRKVHYDIYKKNLAVLNGLLQKTGYDYRYSLRDLVDHIDIFPLSDRGEILYYLSSVLNHNLYFYNISSLGHTKPMGQIGKDIDQYFGSYENFKKEFIKTASYLKGSGYTFLVRDANGKLLIVNMSNEDSPYSYGMTPIISLDLWEHAYFLDHLDHREIYVENFFQVIDFVKINAYYERLLTEKK